MISTPRSNSLPTVTPPLPTNGFNVSYPIVGKDSRPIAPMTPPMSPTDPVSRMDEMLVDHPLPHSKDSDVDHLSLQDSETGPDPLPVHPPPPTLDGSRECLPRSLRLTDFEVRGTLGMSHSYHPLLHDASQVLDLTVLILVQALARLAACSSFDSVAPPTKRDLPTVSLSRSSANRRSSGSDKWNT